MLTSEIIYEFKVAYYSQSAWIMANISLSRIL